MSTRNSGYQRMPADTYVTPPWVYHALFEVEPWAIDAWDCAPVDADFDFLAVQSFYPDIATNPPFGLADEFCRHAIKHANRIAMLLPVGFDSAASRYDLFAFCISFKAEYRITTRIRWENLIQKKAGPSSNHSWFVWDKAHRGLALKGWLKRPSEAAASFYAQSPIAKISDQLEKIV